MSKVDCIFQAVSITRYIRCAVKIYSAEGTRLLLCSS